MLRRPEILPTGGANRCSGGRAGAAAALWALLAWAPAMASAVEGVTPPTLLDHVTPAAPEIPAGQPPRSVLLELTIDAAGTVSAVEVARSAGPAFDDAARAAARRLRFSPATREGAPIAVRVHFRYDFEPAEPAPPTPADPAPPPAPSAPTDPAAVPAPPDAPPAVDRLTVRGASAADRRRASAEAVHVIDIAPAQQQSADLGEVLARAQGVGVRRSGGLGSSTRFSLNGLTDDQIRFFLDDVPLELAGYPFGLSNMPVNLVERVEIYRGVVPVRFGADALGGAVNLVTDERVDGTHGSASYQLGSFGTHRATAGFRHQHAPSGLFVRLGGFYDDADNDYPVDVEVSDARGRLSTVAVRRFHDAYRAAGANLETGVVDRAWARRLLLRAFFTDYDKQLQHNPTMTVPYGEVTFGERALGGSLRFENTYAGALRVDAVAGYSQTRSTFLDVATCQYDWYGRCVRQRFQPGEVTTTGRDQALIDRTVFGRASLEWFAHPQHTLRLTLAPTATRRTGETHRLAEGAVDPLDAERDVFTQVVGLEYEAHAFDDRLETTLFGKAYTQRLRSVELLPGGLDADRDRDTDRFGGGAGLRYRLTDWLDAKVSYEWATRLPRADEIFGNGRFIVANLELEPEESHNANLGVHVDLAGTALGDWRADAQLFVRDADALIVIIGQDRTYSYRNLYAARSQGYEAAAGWTSPGAYVALDGNLTWLDLRNRSTDGPFGKFEGDRIPNRPYMFANGSARLQLRDVFADADEIALTWHTRYVHAFFRGWESLGRADLKQTVPSQLLHTLALGYVIDVGPLELGSTAEVQNLTDEDAFDFFGAQRPGRAFYFKQTAAF